MPIEIKELQIKAVITNQADQQASTSSQAGAITPLPKDNIEKVFTPKKKKKE